MLLSWCFAVLLVGDYVLLAAHNAEKKYIFVSRHREHGITWHSYYSTQTAPDGYQPITDSNKEPEEVSYFWGYSSSYSPSRDCSFDLPLHIMEADTPMPDDKNRRERLRILKEGDLYTGFKIVDTVYVAGSSCSGKSQGLKELYQASCSKIITKEHETMYSRLENRPKICEKSHYLHHEEKFYAYVDRPCPNLPDPSNGQLQAKWDEWERLQEYTCSCNTGYRLQGNGRIHCRHNGQWSGPTPTCTRVRCSKLEDPQHGRLRFLDTPYYAYGSEVTYICDHGYRLYPPRASTTCQANGEWSSSKNEMSCKPVDCGLPEVPNDGKVQANLITTFRHTAQFSCNHGFRLKGADNATCQADGKWRYNSRIKPSCRGIRCPRLSHPDNGQVVGSSHAVGSQRSFHCESGYSLIGPKTVTCLQIRDKGQWSKGSPSCKVMNCNKPAAPENGVVTGSQYSYGSTIRYSCNAGYRLQGEAQSICRMGGWEGKVPTCVAITCPDPGDAAHAQREGSSYIAGATVTYTCESGYVLRGVASIRCGDDGRWSSRRPSCQPIACPGIKTPRYSSREGDAVTYGATVHFYCHPGYKIRGDPKTTCLANGTWSNPAPVCSACPLGFYKEKREDRECSQCPQHSTTVTTASSSQRYCTCVEGTTGPPGGPCTVVRCDALSAPENGRLSDVCGTERNAQCTVTCDAGYVLSAGTRRRRCTAQGWTGSAPKCTACPENTYKLNAEAVSCTPCPQNSVTAAGHPANSVQDCKCAPGFARNSVGACTDVDECKVSNGGCNQTCDNTVGSFSCRCNIPGYALMADGKGCFMNQTCPALTQRPDHGNLSCSYTQRTNGHLCFIRCDQGFFFVSGTNNYLTCGSTTEYQWSHRLVNKTARIPACTREFFIDVELPMRLNYKASAGCSTPPMNQSALTLRLEAAVNTVPVCRQRCRVNDLRVTCQKETGEMVADFDVLLKNPHPDEVPFNCTPACRGTNMRTMLGYTFQLKQKVEALVKTQPPKFQLTSQEAPVVDPSSFWTDRPRLLCDPGRVLTKNRLCVPCDKGFHLPKRDMEFCIPCPKGTYQNEMGKTYCKPCLEGSTTVGEGADHPIMCSVKVAVQPAVGEPE